jgi:NAD(P)-dependent dehydrogenase (short-subunit alcohol dehydrogenase family)
MNDDKVMLITGGTSGIGKATAELMIERGWRVVVTGQSESSVARAADVLGPQALALRADARSPDDARRVAEIVGDRIGPIDAVFLNAGVSRRLALDAATESDWDEIFAINARGQFFTLQSVLGLLADGGSVTFTIGVGVSRGLAGGSVVAASRAALLGMVPSLAVELAPRRIRVNAVSPGVIETPIWSRSGLNDGAVRRVLDAQAERIPLGRVGAARDVAETVSFLASDGAAYLTGQHITVGGGIDVAG